MTFKCKSCGFEYQASRLKKSCERRPVTATDMPMGSVFKIPGYEIFGILYGVDHVQHQTHMTLYKTATTGLCIDGDNKWEVAPETLIEADILNRASSVTDEEFKNVKAALKHTIEEYEQKFGPSNKEHAIILKELKLVPYSRK
jgi:hypothetical protein